MSSDVSADEISEISIDSIGVNEEIETFESHLDENGESTPVDCQEVLIGELFERSPTDHPLVGPGDEGFVCKTCSKRFDDLKKLMRHMGSHNRPRFKCEHCGKFLKSRSSYNSHLQRHRTGKQFECETCGKGFAATRDLNNHLKTHETEPERFRCDECGKDFGRIYSLLAHKKLHTGEEVFSCAKCDKVFPKRRNLLLHERSHLVEEERQ